MSLQKDRLEGTKFGRIKAFLAEQGYPSYRYRQLTQAVFDQHIRQFDGMTALPKTLRDELAAEFGEEVLSVRVVAETVAPQTKKVLFELEDGNRVEAVAMQYRAGWESFCISSQIGCGLACPFCATGAIGLLRNMTTDEIVNQILYFHLNGHKIDSISFMGMGEALANPNVFTAVKAFMKDEWFNMSPRRITISTVGVIPGIHRLTEELPQVNLTFSLHTPFSDQRDELVPLNRKYPLAEVMEALDQHIQLTGRKVYIAYVLLDGVNDTAEHANGVISLLTNRGNWDYLYHVNLIRYNPAVGAPVSYSRPEEETVGRFHQQLKEAGVSVTIRQSFGVDVDAACGQLYARYEPRAPHLVSER